MDSKDLELIKHLVPFDEKSEDELKPIMANATISQFEQGKMIFKREDEDCDVYWLLSGAIDLLDENFDAKRRTAGDDAARYPIDNNNPHRKSAVSTEETRILVIGRTESGLLSTGVGASSDYAVSGLDEDEDIDWMSSLLSSPLFEFIPPANIQSLFSKFEELQFRPGETVIRQSEPGDYFYVIQSGLVKVVRKIGEKKLLLAELKAGDSFGQDALISSVPRNATITMKTPGTMMRLSAPNFESLLMEPVVELVSLDETNEMIAKADPKTYILDVRNPEEAKANKIDGALNIPVLLLRKNLSKLKPEAVYVMASDGDKRARLGAYILNEKGFTAYVLQ